jgi:hypothetical protein
MQLADTGICVAVFPVADAPLWQLVQLVATVKPVWSMPVAGNHADVLWHVLQAACVGIWLADLPAVVLPLWQLEQAAGATPT